MSSILETITHMIGPSGDYTYFNTDLIIHINAAFSRLCQLGVGPKTPFHISDETAEWSDFMEDDGMLEDVKQYIYLKTRIAFDPPANSFLEEAIQKQIDQLEWLMNSVAEVGY